MSDLTHAYWANPSAIHNGLQKIPWLFTRCDNNDFSHEVILIVNITISVFVIKVSSNNFVVLKEMTQKRWNNSKRKY
jgi:hypothetical protein